MARWKQPVFSMENGFSIKQETIALPSILNSRRLHKALLEGVRQWTSARGEVVFSCQSPDRQGEMQRLSALFTLLGQPLSPGELVALCEKLDRQLSKSHGLPGEKLVVRYEPAKPPEKGFACQIAIAQAPQQPMTRGSWVLPCVPALEGDYADKIDRLFAILGQPLSPTELKRLQAGLAVELDKGFRASPYSRLVFRYQSVPGKGFACHVKAMVQTLEERCQYLVETHSEPLFGRYPDAKVMAVAATLPDAATSPILDIGAGTGRNTLPLARLGYPVDAVELAPAFATELQAALEGEGLSGRVIRGDVLDDRVSLRSDRYRCVILAEVVPHFHSDWQLRSLMEKMSEAMVSGGLLLFSTFLAVDGYEPDALALQLSRVTDAFVFTRSQLALALKNLPLQLISDESVVEYEQAHLPTSAWPPTEWFCHWASGRRLFALTREQPPVELRWILCRRL
ncbi:MAG: class I SAM-dependent methyltransferase [Geitlerinemataceae cyanobacterium]